MDTKKVFVRLPFCRQVKPAFSIRVEETKGTIDIASEVVREGPSPYAATVRFLEDGRVGNNVIYQAGQEFPVRKHEILDA